MQGFKSFAIKFFIFCLPVLVGLAIYTWYYYHDDKFKYLHTTNGWENYWALRKSNTAKKVKKLLFGDSVAQQLFDNRVYNGDSLYSLTCNQAVSCAGFYIILKDFLDKNHDSLPEQVIFVVHPLSLQNDLDQVYTFQYFIKPFNCEPYKQYFSPLVKQRIKHIPFYYLSQFPFFKISNWAPDFRPGKPATGHFLSPVTLDYLARIKNLCDSLHVPFVMLPPPVSEVHRGMLTQNNKLIIHEATAIGMQSEFAAYLNSIKYMDNTLYSDRIHFIEPEKMDVDYINKASSKP